MKHPTPELRTIIKELYEPYPDIIRLNPDATAHHLKIVDGMVWIRPIDRVNSIHEVGHFLTRDPKFYFGLDVPRVNYGFKRPGSFEGGLQMMRNELCAFAITDVLWWHLAGQKFEYKPDFAERQIRFIYDFIKMTWPAVQIERMTFVDRLDMQQFYRSWLHPVDDLLWWWEQTLNRLRLLAQEAKASGSGPGETAVLKAA